MPTICKSEVCFGGVKYFRVVNFSVKTGMFTTRIPPECVKVVGYDNLRSETLEGLEKKFSEESQKCLDSKVVTRKVIVYTIEMNAKNHEASGVFDSLGYGDGGIGLLLKVGVYEERKYDSNISYDLIDSSLPERLSEEDYQIRCGAEHGKTKIIGWSEEREEFFRSFVEAMEKLCQKIINFMGSEKQLLDAIAKGTRILPPPEQRRMRA